MPGTSSRPPLGCGCASASAVASRFTAPAAGGFGRAETERANRRAANGIAANRRTLTDAPSGCQRKPVNDPSGVSSVTRSWLLMRLNRPPRLSGGQLHSTFTRSGGGKDEVDRAAADLAAHARLRVDVEVAPAQVQMARLPRRPAHRHRRVDPTRGAIPRDRTAHGDVVGPAQVLQLELGERVAGVGEGAATETDAGAVVVGEPACEHVADGVRHDGGQSAVEHRRLHDRALRGRRGVGEHPRERLDLSHLVVLRRAARVAGLLVGDEVHDDVARAPAEVGDCHHVDAVRNRHERRVREARRDLARTFGRRERVEITRQQQGGDVRIRGGLRNREDVVRRSRPLDARAELRPRRVGPVGDREREERVRVGGPQVRDRRGVLRRAPRAAPRCPRVAGSRCRSPRRRGPRRTA